MKYTCFLLIIFFCISCSSKKNSKQTILTPSNLTAELFEIDPSVENTISTKKGATVRFPANAFKLNGSGKVKVEIKEAYSMKDILLGGLVTESNGRQLSSGGMIYINAQQNDKDVALQKTAGVSIPATNYADGMQLFKGEYTKDSTINWVEPRPLDSTPKQMIERGKQLFLANCSACHGIDKPSTGPELYDIVNRSPSKGWLYTFTRNWEEAFSYRDSTKNNYCAYTGCKIRYSPTVMNKFPALTDADLDGLYAYIQYETEKIKAPPYRENFSPTWCDHCLKTGTEYSLNYADNARPAVTAPAVNNPVINTGGQPVDAAGNISETAANIEYEPVDTTSLTYVFSIQRMGWYNVDVIVEGLPGAGPCDISARITQEELEKNLTVQLIIPSRKITLQATGENNSWNFMYGENKPFMPRGVEAYVLAFWEKDGRFMYGLSRFTIQKTVTVPCTLAETTKEEFIKSIKKLGLEGLTVQGELPETTTAAGNDGDAVTAKDRAAAPDTAKRDRPQGYDTLWRDCGCITGF